MIGRIKGQLLEKLAPNLVLDVRDLAYELQAPMTTFYRIGELGSTVTLFTHLSVSENSHQLFGFFEKRDRELFRLLVKVSGVGPKLAIGILSMEVDDFVRCVVDENVTALVKLPGVGKKTAERLVVEMKDKLQSWLSSSIGDSEASSISRGETLGQDTILEEAKSALVSLGYRSNDAEKVIARIAKQGSMNSSEALIRAALKSMIPA